MNPAKPRRTAAHTLELTPETIEEMRSRLPQVADATVTAIIDEVPQWWLDGHRKEPTGRPRGRPKGAKDRQPRKCRCKTLPADT